MWTRIPYYLLIYHRESLLLLWIFFFGYMYKGNLTTYTYSHDKLFLIYIYIYILSWLVYQYHHSAPNQNFWLRRWLHGKICILPLLILYILALTPWVFIYYKGTKIFCPTKSKNLLLFFLIIERGARAIIYD